MVNETHDSALRTWVPGANDPDTDFPIQNLPFAAFRRAGSTESFRGGVAIGPWILDLGAVAGDQAFTGRAAEAARAAASPKLNQLMVLGPEAWSALRLALSCALRVGSDARQRLQSGLLLQADAEFDVPAQIGDYTDFYTSIHHATNIGRQFRPDAPLLPNYRWVPIGYHGRSSSIGVSGELVRRPAGQLMLAGAARPELAPSRKLDIELELGVFIGTGNLKGEPIAIAQAESHVFGVCLLNDWSARDIQAWEYQPLGPFLSKNFATTLSPWIVTLEALAPFRGPLLRDPDDPEPLPYLVDDGVRRRGAIDIQLQAELQTAAMRAAACEPAVIARTSYRHAYWTISQIVTHHTINGCSLQPGDLLGTGTLSGPGAGEAAALIEMTAGGKNPLRLPAGESRAWLEDGDVVTLRAWCERPGSARIGFGICSGTIAPCVANVPRAELQLGVTEP